MPQQMPVDVRKPTPSCHRLNAPGQKIFVPGPSICRAAFSVLISVSQPRRTALRFRTAFPRFVDDIDAQISVQLSRLAHAYQAIISEAKMMARRATLLRDNRTNDLLISHVLRANEFQMWFVSEHLVEKLPTHATQWA